LVKTKQGKKKDSLSMETLLLSETSSKKEVGGKKRGGRGKWGSLKTGRSYLSSLWG